VLRKFGFQLHPDDIRDVTRCRPGAIEKVLLLFQTHLAKFKATEEKLVQERVTESTAPSRGRSSAGGSQSRSSAITPTAPSRDENTRESFAKEIPSPKNRSHDRLAIDSDVILEKEQTIHELRETIVIMTEKIKKLEQLVRIKDSKIEALTKKLYK